MKRYFYLGLGSLAMCVFGLMYNWTVFSPAVSAQLNVSAASVANVFSVCQICFCAGGVLSGFIYYRVPFRASMLIASLMIGVGLFLTSRADQVAMIYACYSVLFSLGAGFAYKALLTTVMTWFNDKPGLASGVLVMGAGLTAFVFNVPTSLIIESLGWRTAMLLLALIAFVLSLVVSLIVRPRGIVRKAGKLEEGEEEGQVSTGQMMKSTRFYMYFIWSVLVLAGCSSLTGTAVSCGISFGISATMAATLSMIISLFNSVSRVFYGIIYDKIGRKTAMGIATTLFIIAVIILYCAFTLGSTALLAVSFIFVGLSFGADDFFRLHPDHLRQEVLSEQFQHPGNLYAVQSIFRYNAVQRPVYRNSKLPAFLQLSDRVCFDRAGAVLRPEPIVKQPENHGSLTTISHPDRQDKSRFENFIQSFLKPLKNTEKAI